MSEAPVPGANSNAIGVGSQPVVAVTSPHGEETINIAVLKGRKEDMDPMAGLKLEGQEEEEKVLEEVEQGGPTPNEMRSFAEADINALVTVAIAGIDTAEHTTSQDCQPFVFAEIFQMAREALLDGRVVETIMMLRSIMTVAGLSKLRQKSLDESVNKVRDVLVMRICTIQEDPESYIEFKALSENAFNMQLDKTTHSQLAHAYRKLAISTHARLEKWGFVSNAHLEAKRRGGTRLRPKKRDTGRASASASCTAALPLELPDPAYVMLQPANTTGYNGEAHTTIALDQRQKNGFQLPASRQPLDMVGYPPPEQGYPQDAVQGCHTLLNTTSHWAATATNPAAQAVWGLSGPTMNSTTDSQGSMQYHMHHHHFANSYTYSVDKSTAYNNPLQNGMMQGGMSGFPEDPSALQHPPTNQHHFPAPSQVQGGNGSQQGRPEK